MENQDDTFRDGFTVPADYDQWSELFKDQEWIDAEFDHHTMMTRAEMIRETTLRGGATPDEWLFSTKGAALVLDFAAAEWPQSVWDYLTDDVSVRCSRSWMTDQTTNQNDEETQS